MNNSSSSIPLPNQNKILHDSTEKILQIFIQNKPKNCYYYMFQKTLSLHKCANEAKQCAKPVTNLKVNSMKKTKKTTTIIVYYT